MVSKRGIVRGSVCLAVLACASDATAEGPALASEPEPQTIVGGEPTREGEFDDVVRIESSGAGPCSGVVVAPRVVLTAAHCLDDLRTTDAVRVFHGSNAAASVPVVAIESGAHPRYDPAASEDIHDYGYVLLGSDFVVPGGYVPPITTQAEWDDAMVEGREVTVVGYGNDGAGHYGIKRKVTTTIRRISDEGLEFYAGGEGLDSCDGDSGGPAYVRLGDGSLRLAGIVSRGSEVCGQGGWYGVPYPALCWVDEQTGAGLSDAACTTCDCLDTKPSADAGCSIAPCDMRWPWVALVLVALWRRTMR